MVVSACGCGDRSAPGGVSKEGPAERGRWFVWMDSDGPNPVPPTSAARVFVRDRRSGEVVRVNPPGTFAESGDVWGERLYFQLIRRGRSSIAAFDLETRRLTKLPRFVNRGGWAWRPSISDGRLLFGEIDYTTNRYSIVVADLRAGTRRVVAAVDGHAAYAAPGQINGSWATWTECPDNKCNVHRLDLRTGAEAEAPGRRAGILRYGPSVARNGTAYFGQATTLCEASKIVRWSGDGTLTTASTLPDGTAFQYSYVASGSRFLYDAVACNRGAPSEIRVLRLPSHP